MSVIWTNEHLTTATLARSRTMANLRANPRARAAIGHPDDVVIMDGDASIVDVADIDSAAVDRYAEVSHDPRQMPGFLYLYLLPNRVQVWNGFHEYAGRTVMLDGYWLDKPID